ncbi:MAG: NAD(P)H-dependent oxidoreductase [Marmoricola sp.]
MRIAIIVGSTRPGRKGSSVGQWVHEHAVGREGKHDVHYDLIELADQGLPLLDEAVDAGAADRDYERASTRAWSRLVDGYDGFVFVTPEYNHGVPAAMKNAVDLLYPEWNNKAVGFVGYGFDGGTRAVEQWRTILSAVVMFTVRSQVALQNFADFDGNEFIPQERRASALSKVLDQLEAATAAVRTLRA